ncbi:MAG: dihydroxy-acid dehydratase [Dehalococcoidales bacterium]|nr:dihydroxy-acid dehydratase [Dehalococcoidales bacterium]
MNNSTNFERILRNYGHRAIFKAIGFTEKELSLPRIAVINSWSEQSPGHSHLREVAEGVKAGIRMAGGMPFEIEVPGLCSVPHKDPPDMLYDMPQREAVVAAVESSLNISWCDGWVGIASCDKIIPGMILAALRLNRPFIFLGGGQMFPSDYEGRRIDYMRGQAIIRQELQKMSENSISFESINQKISEVTSCVACSAGACGELTTGNTLAVLSEGMGIALPGSSTSPAVSAEKIWHAKETGEKILELVRKNIRPWDIITLASLRNAIAVDMATCGGTNAVVHLQAYAHEAGIPLTLADWDEMSRKVPALANVAPSGPYVLYDYHRAGGTPLVMKLIEGYLDRSCLTVTGKTVGENLAEVKGEASEVIRPPDNPVWPEGATAILKGNLAPRGAATRHTVVENKELLQKTYRARVFNSLQEAISVISSGKPEPVSSGDAVVCRYQGPRGGPGMVECLSLIRVLKDKQLKNVVVITDGRFSGFTQGYLAIGHVCPEAQVGGPLALVRDGDRIRVDIPNRRLDIELSDEELAVRKAEWKPPVQSGIRGMLAIYARIALQADLGAGWPRDLEDFNTE